MVFARIWFSPGKSVFRANVKSVRALCNGPLAVDRLGAGRWAHRQLSAQRRIAARHHSTFSPARRGSACHGGGYFQQGYRRLAVDCMGAARSSYCGELRGDARGGRCAARAERARPLRAARPSHPRRLPPAALAGGARQKATVRSQAREPGGLRRWRSRRRACAGCRPRSSSSACNALAQVRCKGRPAHLCGALWVQQLAPDAV